MPLYEYKCQDCGRVVELLISSSEEAVKPRCTSCDSRNLKRLISRPGFIRTRSGNEVGSLRKVDPRDAVDHMSRTYDNTGIDPGKGFDEVAGRVAAGDSPQELKEAVNEAKKKEAESGK